MTVCVCGGTDFTLLHFDNSNTSLCCRFIPSSMTSSIQQTSIDHLLFGRCMDLLFSSWASLILILGFSPARLWNNNTIHVKGPVKGMDASWKFSDSFI